MSLRRTFTPMGWASIAVAIAGGLAILSLWWPS